MSAQRRWAAPWRQVLPGLVGIVLLAAISVRNRGTVDDAFISFRYLDNWLAGQGLVFNPGERVEGYSNLLWIVLLAPLRALGMKPEIAADILSVLALLAIVVATARAATVIASSRRAGTTSLALIGASAPLAAWSLSGLETTFYAALLALAVWQISVRQAFDPRAGLLFGMAALTRPEGLFVGLLTFLALAARDRSMLRTQWRRRLLSLATLLALPAIQVAWRLFYYGHPLPNTYYAKLGGIEAITAIRAGLFYVLRFARDGGLVLMLTAALAMARPVRRRFRTLHLWTVVAATFAFAIRAGGDFFPFYRFLVAALPPLTILGALGLHSLGRSKRAGPLSSIVPWGALALSTASVALWSASNQPALMRHMALVARGQETLAQWIRKEAHAGDILAINAAGRIPYRTGLVTIDMLGLADATIARSPIVREVGGFTMIGHQKHNGAYVCSHEPRFVVPGGAGALAGRSPQEAETAAALNSFPSDRDFLRHCGDRYRPVSIESGPGRYLVLFERHEDGPAASAFDPGSASAEGWFDEGVRRLARGDPEGAVDAFRMSLAIAPGVPSVRVNLAFALMDSGRLEEAEREWSSLAAGPAPPLETFYGLALCAELSGDTARAKKLWHEYLTRAPADSPWTSRAKDHLRLLGDG